MRGTPPDDAVQRRRHQPERSVVPHTGRLPRACVPHDGRLEQQMGGRPRGGYDFPHWFKSLAALGCPAPRVLAALRAATPGRMGNPYARQYPVPPDLEVGASSRSVRGAFASQRDRASSTLDPYRPEAKVGSYRGDAEDRAS